MQIDPAAVRAVAAAVQSSGEVVGRAAADVAAQGFGSSATGRGYEEHGRQLADSLTRVVGSLQRWRTASVETADLLAAAANRFEAQDRSNARLIGRDRP